MGTWRMTFGCPWGRPGGWPSGARARLRDAGPLPGGAIEDRAAVSWTSTGWTNGRNVERMLDTLWKQGVVTVAGRDGLRRLWGLAEFPVAEDLPEPEIVSRAAEHAL